MKPLVDLYWMLFGFNALYKSKYHHKYQKLLMLTPCARATQLSRALKKSKYHTILTPIACETRSLYFQVTTLQ